MAESELIEVWREIHDGFYEVSNLGNVRRLKPGIATFVGRPVMPVVSGNGYKMVSLGGSKPRRAYVHHLVAEAFIGPRLPGFIVNHRDGHKGENTESNLEYATSSENARHAIKHLTRRKGPTKPKTPKLGPQRGDAHWSARSPEKIARGNRMPHCKLSAEIVIVARARVAAGEMQSVIAREVGISVAQMSRIIRGKRWTYL